MHPKYRYYADIAFTVSDSALRVAAAAVLVTLCFVLKAHAIGISAAHVSVHVAPHVSTPHITTAPHVESVPARPAPAIVPLLVRPAVIVPPSHPAASAASSSKGTKK